MQSLESSQPTPPKTSDASILTLGIASTFTSEPVQTALEFWLKELSLSANIQFSGYGQVFQELIDPSSSLSSNNQGCNVILIRVEDWVRNKPSADLATLEAAMDRTLGDLFLALDQATNRHQTPYIVVVCPPTPVTATASPNQGQLFQRMTLTAIDKLRSLPEVHLITPTDIEQHYSLTNYYDRRTDELGHIPFTPTYFSMLGTAIIRKYHAFIRAPYKVVVLDCDQTLWRGVCGEDGPQGIILDSPHQFLQEFMVQQAQQGMLLCLCSKNVEADVMQVYDTRTDMPLQRAHLVAWRINWQPKSANIQSLAQELNLGLDSFIFVDDNPVECSEVMANCPQVLTLQLPTSVAEIPDFLRHVWAFDHAKAATGADQKRTQLYKQNLERERLRSQALDFQDFLSSLDLKVAIAPMTTAQLPRVAQLTQRTNQFNSTTLRRSESEIQHLCSVAGYHCLAVEVSDRFGDYGLVGVVFYTCQDAALVVDSFMLSCRALGRGVEHRMIATLGALAIKKQLTQVQINYRPTPKNQPLIDFLQSIGNEFVQPTAEGLVFMLPADYAASVQLEQTAPPVAASVPPASSPALVTDPPPAPRSTSLAQIAKTLRYPENIHAAIEGYRKGQRVTPQSSEAGAPPRNPTEQQLASIWAEVLGLKQVGIHDNYFDLGGSSLLAVNLFVQIESTFHKKFPMTVLLDAPTVAQLAAKIVTADPDQASWPSLIKLRPAGTRPPLFMVHGGFGDVLGLVTLEQHLHSDYPFYALQGIGLDGVQRLPDSIAEIARRFIDEIKTVQPNGPYLLGGQCAGGTIAFEMAQQLCHGGDDVAFLALLDTPYPPLTNYFADRLRFYQSNPPILYRRTHPLYYVFTLFSLRWKLGYHLGQFRQKSRRQQWQYLSSYGQRLGQKVLRQLPSLKVIPPPMPTRVSGTGVTANDAKDGQGQVIAPPETSPPPQVAGITLFQRHSSDHHHKLIKHRFFEDLNTALARYQPQPYNGKITYFLPLLNSYAPTRPPHHWQSFFPHTKPVSTFSKLMLGWDQVAQGQVEVHEFSGTHIGMIREPQVQQLAEKLNHCLQHLDLKG